MAVFNPFTPSFGGMPEHFFGRSHHIASVQKALDDAYSPNRILFYTGNRGSGKTALLERLSMLARNRRWYAVDVHSTRAVDELASRLVGSGLSANLQVSPKLSIPGGIGLSLGSASLASARPSDLSDALLARCNALAGHRGVFLTIDEIQKIPAQDMEEICAAVQMARRKGFPVALMMAGLPGSKDLVASYDGCTFMQRVREVKIGSLSIDETTDAFTQLLSLTTGMSVEDGVVWEMSAFSQGYPYLIQLVGYHLVRLMQELYPVGHAEARADHVVDAALVAYEAYKNDVIVPSLRGLRPKSKEYLATMARLLNDKGEASTGEVAASLGKTLPQVSSCRDTLIKHGLIAPGGRGKVRFALPHLSRYMLENTDEDETDTRGEWVIR